MDESSAEQIRKDITDDFCRAFRRRQDFIGPAARLVAAGELPDGVEVSDQRVALITTLCSIGGRIPECDTCCGTGFFAIGMTRDICGDCGGSGVQNCVCG